MTAENPTEQKRLKAQAHFDKGEERKREAAKSFADLASQKNAEAAKTARLRALRLAKEEADAVIAREKAAEKLAAASMPKPPRKTAVKKTTLAAVKK